MLNFTEFLQLQEKNVASFNKDTDMYKNPSSSDIAELNKNHIRSVRYIVDLSDESVYVWDADAAIHYEGVEKLSSLGFIKSPEMSEDNSNFYRRFLTGTANVTEGELVHSGSDLFDWLAFQIKKSRSQWPEKVTNVYRFLKFNIGDLLSKFKFAEKYVRGCTGPNSSIARLKQSLDLRNS